MNKFIRRISALFLSAAVSVLPLMISAEADYSAALERIGQYGLMVGRTTEDFAAQETVTRAELAVIACKLAKAAPSELAAEYADVPSGHWAAGYIQTAVELGVMTADNGSFSPDSAVTKAQAARTMASLLALDYHAQLYNGYTNGYMTLAVRFMGIFDAPVAADEAMARADMAVMLSRALDAPVPQRTIANSGNDTTYTLTKSDYTIEDYLSGKTDRFSFTSFE